MSPEDVAKILDELGQRLGPYGEHAWTILVRQKVVEGLVYGVAEAAFLVIGMIATIALARLTLRLWRADVERQKTDRYSDADPFGYALVWGVGGMIGLVFAVSVAVALIASVLQLANPEYYALRDLLGVVRK